MIFESFEEISDFMSAVIDFTEFSENDPLVKSDENIPLFENHSSKGKICSAYYPHESSSSTIYYNSGLFCWIISYVFGLLTFGCMLTFLFMLMLGRNEHQRNIGIYIMFAGLGCIVLWGISSCLLMANRRR